MLDNLYNDNNQVDNNNNNNDIVKNSYLLTIKNTNRENFIDKMKKQFNYEIKTTIEVPSILQQKLNKHKVDKSVCLEKHTHT